jgi:cell division septation protein DedD
MELEDCCAAATTQNDPSLLGACPTEPNPIQPTPVEPTPVEPTPVEPTPIQPTPVDPTPTTDIPENPVAPEGLETIESMVCLHEVYETISE